MSEDKGFTLLTCPSCGKFVNVLFMWESLYYCQGCIDKIGVKSKDIQSCIRYEEMTLGEFTERYKKEGGLNG